MLKTRGFLTVISAMAIFWQPLVATAEQPNRAAVEAWLASTPAQLPAAGSVVRQADLESLRALLPPGYFDDANYADTIFTIEATGDYHGPAVFQEATAANAGKTTLRPDGGLDHYTAGQPFDPAQFDDVTPADAGLMAAWNHVYRWQYYGYRVKALDMVYVQPTEGDKPGKRAGGMEGGGTAERALVQTFHRVYLSHLAMLPAQNYRVNASDSANRYFKDYISFLEPFDVAGTTFVVERAEDANEDDQVNTYLPSQRRVRRVSAKERADNFMGSNFTLDDFEGFSGRVMDYQWTYRGQKQLLHVSNSQEKALRFGGPHSNVAIDRWQVRNCFVVVLTPRWEGHPMAAKYLFIDEQTGTPAIALNIDRKDQLWRVLMTHYQRPIPDASTAARALETSLGAWRGSVALDLGNQTTTIARATSVSEYPTMTDREIERTFSLSRLTEGR